MAILVCYVYSSTGTNPFSLNDKLVVPFSDVRDEEHRTDGTKTVLRVNRIPQRDGQIECPHLSSNRVLRAGFLVPLPRSSSPPYDVLDERRDLLCNLGSCRRDLGHTFLQWGVGSGEKSDIACGLCIASRKRILSCRSRHCNIALQCFIQHKHNTLS